MKFIEVTFCKGHNKGYINMDLCTEFWQQDDATYIAHFDGDIVRVKETVEEIVGKLANALS